MKSVIISIILLALIQSDSAQPTSAMSTERTHPGCSIFWFLKDCPLGEIFGVDPFNMYPWEKFCRQYSAFKGIKECQPFEKKEDEKEITAKESTPKNVKQTKMDHKELKEETTLPSLDTSVSK